MSAIVIGGKDYELSENQQSVYVLVNNISVHIKREDEGVVVDLYPRDDETSEALASAWLTFAEVTKEN